MRSIQLVVATLMLAGCSAVYPADDFSHAPCGPVMQHWQAPSPCGAAVTDCLNRCEVDNELCIDACYERNPVCKSCLINESILCVREWGCEPEYEALTCCAEDMSCDLSDDACVASMCNLEVLDSTSCYGAVGHDCDSQVIDFCFR